MKYLLLLLLSFNFFITWAQFGQGFKVYIEKPHYPIKSVILESLDGKKTIRAKSNNYFKKCPQGEWKVVVKTNYDVIVDSIIDFTAFKEKQIVLNNPFFFCETSKLKESEPIFNMIEDKDTLIVILTSNVHHFIDALNVIRNGNDYLVDYYEGKKRLIKKFSLGAASELSHIESMVKFYDSLEDKGGGDCFSVSIDFDFILKNTRYHYYSESCKVVDFTSVIELLE